MGILSGLLSMFGWGIADFLGAQSSRRIGPVLTLFWMQLIGFLAALIYFLVNLSFFNAADITRFLIILAVIGFFYAVSYLAFYKGFQVGQVSLVSPMGASWGAVTVILSVIFYREILQTKQIIAIILITIGIILISLNFKTLIGVKKLTILPGVKEGIVAMLGFGISPFLLTPIARNLGWFLPVIIFRLFTILFLASFMSLKRQSFKINPGFLPMIFSIGLLDIGAFFALSFGVMGNYASIVAPIAASFPLVTIILARTFLKERIIPSQAFGILGIIAGIILISI